MMWDGQGREVNSWGSARGIVGELWRGGRPIWQAVRSCFGSGVWRGKKPWIGKEKW